MVHSGLGARWKWRDTITFRLFTPPQIPVTSSYFWVLGFSLLGSVLSVAAAGTYLLLPATVREKSLDYLLSFAIGMLLGAGFLHLLPEALEHAAGSFDGLMATALVAILVFFLLEKGLIWRHHHHHDGTHSHGDDHHINAVQSDQVAAD